jgi:hypothetical protein
LRAFCNHRQDDWVRWLPLAQFVHNSRRHSATNKSPFELLYGFNPRSYPSLQPGSSFPAVEERLSTLQSVRAEAQASLASAARIMQEQHGDFQSKWKPFKVGDLVWLEGKNIRTTQPKAKLGDKRHGPFRILNVLSPITFRLDIPRKWRMVHPVFHASLLSPYRETDAHGPNFTRPAPDLVDDHEEYEVELILDGKPRGSGFVYLVKWLGYPDSDNQWIARSSLPHAQEAIDEYHVRHPSAPRPKNYVPGSSAPSAPTAP